MKFHTFIPFVEHLGFELLKFEDGEAEIAVTLREGLCNSWSVAHGGVTMTLLDVTMAHAARATGLGGEGQSNGIGVVTIEMKTSFMRPGLGRLHAKGKRVHGTASLAFCEAQVFDEKGALVAQATGTFKYLKGLPAGGRKIMRNNASD
ncbi:PaaI family thioesterase [Rhizobacter sp. J219]|uniref:PaaI family thioesterase n=1 Tax=Rhizobacter sp. J219 TaxID=2898430 RepID=UPI002151FA8E|nr:PaaI family thioesterase [Rhizobacter sp. J219]MCR5881817.1 PaaI family thioesterase [Rhizobacter sp. J219]